MGRLGTGGAGLPRRYFVLNQSYFFLNQST